MKNKEIGKMMFTIVLTLLCTIAFGISFYQHDPSLWAFTFATIGCALSLYCIDYK